MRYLKILVLILISILLFSCVKEKTKEEDHTQQNEIQNGSDDKVLETTSYAPVIIDNLSLDNIYFYNIKINDSVEVIKEKLKLSGKEISEGTDYAGIYKIWNKDMLLEERINLGFLVWCYKNQIVSFTEFDVSLEKCQEILLKLDTNFNLSKLRYMDSISFVIQDWVIEFFRDEKSYTYCEYCNSMIDEINKLYSEYE